MSLSVGFQMLGETRVTEEDGNPGLRKRKAWGFMPCRAYFLFSGRLANRDATHPTARAKVLW